MEKVRVGIPVGPEQNNDAAAAARAAGRASDIYSLNLAEYRIRGGPRICRRGRIVKDASRRIAR
jgi:hypothetical protein